MSNRPAHAEARKAWGLSAQPVAAGLGQRRPLSPCTRCPPQLASRLNRDASSEQNRGPELFPNADRKFALQRALVCVRAGLCVRACVRVRARERECVRECVC